MNRLSRVAVLLPVVLGALVRVVPASAGTDPITGVIVIPGSNNDLVAIPIVVVTLTLVAVAVAVANWIRKWRFS